MDTDSFIVYIKTEGIYVDIANSVDTRSDTLSYEIEDDCIDCIENNKIILRSQQRFRSEAHNVFIKDVNKTALRANDDKKL